jgi:hypothetical protein
MENMKFRKFKLFWAWQDREEEAWLRQMAQQGYHLSSLVFSTIYEFTRGVPSDMVYRLDYVDVRKKDLGDYMQLFQTAGWEYVDGGMGWYYFRKLADSEYSNEIYTDVESKIQKYQRMLSYLIIFPIILGWFAVTQIFKENSIGVLNYLIILIMVVWIYIIGSIINRIWQLNRLKKI